MADGPPNGLVKPKEEEESTPFLGIIDSDLSRLLDNPRPLNIERKMSFGEGLFSKPSPCFEPHPHVTDAWDALRRSLVYSRGQPVGTVAELGNSTEKLNYDQVFNDRWQHSLVYKAPPLFDILLLPPALTSDSESWMASDSTDAAEKNNPLKQGKKRKIDSDTIPLVNRIVTAAIRYNDDVKILNFTMSFGLSNLKEKVAQMFKLNGKRLHLKYIDEEDDLILIACDVDLRFAVDTTSIDNRINLICVLDVGPPTGLKLDVIQPSLESVVADNFTFLEYSSDAESLVATGSIDAGEKSRQGKKRKIESDKLLPVTGMVTAKITSNEYMKKFQFFISSGLSNLQNEVARSFKLKGKKLRLKYWDEDGDFILIACDVDLALAVVTTGSNNIINLICLSD